MCGGSANQNGCHVTHLTLHQVLIVSAELNLTAAPRRYTLTSTPPHDVLRVTPRDGVVHVWNATALRDADLAARFTLHINVTYARGRTAEVTYVNVLVLRDADDVHGAAADCSG